MQKKKCHGSLPELHTCLLIALFQIVDAEFSPSKIEAPYNYGITFIKVAQAARLSLR